MRLMLAPMEGVVDHTMRAMLCQQGGVDRCVTEFVRVSNTLLPNRVFYRLCPELHSDGMSAGKTPVYVQLLGGDPELMAANAARAARLGARGIDINFGCPAKCVNNNEGGAVLLQDTRRLYAIVSAVRQAVPGQVPVTAKLRLGFNDRSLALDNALACQDAGASELVFHARTRKDGYRPPAYWAELAPIRDALDIPLIANGEIWTPEDYRRCVSESGCQDTMLGRGLLSNPGLALAIKGLAAPMAWPQAIPMLIAFQQATLEYSPTRYAANRIKQWLNYLQRHFEEAGELFEGIKRENSGAAILEHLQSLQ